MTSREADTLSTSRSGVMAWALWDCGATGVNAIVVTFVFSVYLTEQVGAGLPGPTTPASWLGRVLTTAGVAALRSRCSLAWSSR
jgi:UMF1 family MFS transporter